MSGDRIYLVSSIDATSAREAIRATDDQLAVSRITAVNDSTSAARYLVSVNGSNGSCGAHQL